MDEETTKKKNTEKKSTKKDTTAEVTKKKIRETLESSKYEFFNVTKSARGSISISIILTEKSGIRIKATDKFWEALSVSEAVQVKYRRNELLIARKFSNDAPNYKISKGNIYNSGLVRAIAEKFELDFSDGKSSITFHNIVFKKVINDNGKSITAAIVNMNDR